MNRQWRKTMTGNIRKLSPDEARAIIANHVVHYTGFKGKGPLRDETLRKLTGGYLSQSISWIVMRALGKRAGMCN